MSKEKGDIWVLGDMNFPKLFWDEEDVPVIKPGCSCPRVYEEFIDIMNDFNLFQVVREPTRYENILDLFLTTNNTLVNAVTIIPGLSDHNIVKSVVNIKPKFNKQQPRRSFLFRKANWESFRDYMRSYSSTFLENLNGKSVDQAWSEFKDTIHEGIRKFIPSKLIGSKKHLPWITVRIKRDIRKRDKLYQKFKSCKSTESRKKFLKAKHAVKFKIKRSYENYLEGILGINNPDDDTHDVSNSDFSRKRLFSLLKNSKRDSQGIGLLKDGESTVTTDVDKANALNKQLKSVFSSRSALDLVKLCQGVLMMA